MSQSTPAVPSVYDAIEDEFERLASRLVDEADLELEEIYQRADQRLGEVLGYALTQSVQVDLRLEQLGERIS